MNPLQMKFDEVSFAYEKDLVVNKVSFGIQPGEFVGIIGPNGSGKSTLLKLLGGVLQGYSGGVYFKDRDIHSLKRNLLARSIAWIPQEHPMVFPFKVLEVVLMGRHPYLSALSLEGEKDHAIASEAMELTQTSQFSGRGFNEISGGEKQRVTIASAITQEPEIMLLDEPTSALDIKFQMQILNILKSLNEEKGITILMAIHDLHLASKFCQRLLLMNEGTVVKDGPPESVLQKEILEDVYDINIKLFPVEEDGSIIIAPEG